MRKNKFFGFMALALFAGLFVLTTSCEGPMGPSGADGTPGVDGNAVCMECHNLTVKNEITGEYLASAHNLSHNVWPGGPMVYEYAGGQVSCGACHSEQGFIETQYTGLDTLAHAISLPQAISCKTCHDFHPSLDFENEPNSALRTVAKVDLLMYRDADPTAAPVTIDMGPESNVCANCHQPRKVGPVDDGTGNYTVPHSHYGPHHGPQATSMAGLGAYEVGTGYPAPGTGGKHVTEATCTSCHMHGKDHTWEPGLDGCNTSECHNGSMTTVTDNSRQLAFNTSMGTLETKLKTAGLLDADGHPVPGTYAVDEVGALYNYEWLHDDRSSGLHNFGYLETMLNNSIAVFP